MYKLLLITSKYEDKKNKSTIKKIYAGNWCLKKGKVGKNIIYNWNSNNNFKKNYNYLSKVVRKFNNILSKKLNEIHNVNKDQKYWEILLFPWLTYYISAQFYRWKIINDIVNKNKNLYVNKLNLENCMPANDSLDFHAKITNSGYVNEVFFGRVINFLISKKKIYKIFSKRKIKFKNDINKFCIPLKSSTFKEKIKNILTLIMSKICKQRKILICEGLISLKDLIQLNLNLRQFPIFSTNIFNNRKYSYEISILKLQKDLRNKIQLNEEKLDSFENFINTYIMSDMPKHLLEGFKIVSEMANKLNLSVKYVIVFYEHYHNELFKFWYADNHKSTKLIVSPHGGAMQTNSAAFGLDTEIANKKISFIPEDECTFKKKVRLPFPKFIRRKRKNPKFLIYNTYDSEYYPCRYGISNNTYMQNRNEKDLLSFKKNLNDKIYSYLKISSKLSNSISIKNINSISDGKKNITNIHINKLLDIAKLMICSYPQTTFLESIASGPTIAIFNYEDWFPHKKYIKIYDKLISNNVFFESSEELSFFINKNWENIDIWWNNLKEKKIIDEYLNFFQKDSKYLSEWNKFLGSLS